MKATISSITFINKENGTTANPKKALLKMKIKDTKLSKMMCPEVKLANKRTINENGFMKIPMISTGVKMTNIHFGTPGMAKICVQYVDFPLKFVTKKAITANTIVMAIFPVTLNPSGVNPKIFKKNTKTR